MRESAVFRLSQQASFDCATATAYATYVLFATFMVSCAMPNK